MVTSKGIVIAENEDGNFNNTNSRLRSKLLRLPIIKSLTGQHYTR